MDNYIILLTNVYAIVSISLLILASVSPFQIGSVPPAFYIGLMNVTVSGFLSAAYRYAMYRQTLELRFIVFRFVVGYIITMMLAGITLSLLIITIGLLQHNLEAHSFLLIVSGTLLLCVVPIFLDGYLERQESQWIRRVMLRQRTDQRIECQELRETTYARVVRGGRSIFRIFAHMQISMFVTFIFYTVNLLALTGLLFGSSPFSDPFFLLILVIVPASVILAIWYLLKTRFSNQVKDLARYERKCLAKTDFT